MRVVSASVFLIAGLIACGSPVLAQDIVAAAPSNTQAIAAGDMASVAVAQLNDSADAAKAAQKVELYKQLMELNGMSRNVRMVLAGTKTSTRLIIIDRTGTDHLTPDQDAKYNKIADTVLKDTESSLINDIAKVQSANFSTEEIQQLITANASVAAAKYNATKFLNPDANAQQVQTYMVDAMIKIIKTFTESVSA
jgi:hypothetical protein